jgi:hypothetical protein
MKSMQPSAPKDKTPPAATPAVRLILAAAPLAFGLVALWLGQDTSWDLRNYHFYNPFAYLTGRMGHDVAVSHVATYYNPLMYIPFYYAVTSLPPKAVGFILGVIPGLNFLLLYAIARHVIRSDRPGTAAWVCLATAATGMLGQVNLAETGTSYGDNVVSLLVLCAVYLIVGFRRRMEASFSAGWAVAAAAGVAAGAAFGLKQPFAVYAVGLCAAFFALQMPFHRRFSLAFIFGLGVLAGAALTSGFWLLEMWQRFENPLFPYFNQFFTSPWAAEGSYRDARFIPTSLAMYLLFPFYFTIDPLQVGEVVFRDLRFPVLHVLLAALLVKTAACFFKKREAASAPPATAAPTAGPADAFLILFIAVSFILWMALFAVYRYVIVCELLAPLVMFQTLGRLVRSRRRQVAFALACFVLLLATLQMGDWGRKPWTADYFGFTPPPLAEPENTLVLVTGHDPVAYMIPFFPPEVRFLRIQGYMTGPSPTPNATDRLMQDAVARHSGPLFLLYRSYEEWTAVNALAAFGLQLDRSTCLSWTTAVEPQPQHPFYFCRLPHPPQP